MEKTTTVTEFAWTPGNRALLSALMRRRVALADADAEAIAAAKACTSAGMPEPEVLADALAAIERGDVSALPSDVLQRVVTLGLVCGRTSLSVETSPRRRRSNSDALPAPETASPEA